MAAVAGPDTTQSIPTELVRNPTYIFDYDQLSHILLTCRICEENPFTPSPYICTNMKCTVLICKECYEKCEKSYNFTHCQYCQTKDTQLLSLQKLQKGSPYYPKKVTIEDLLGDLNVTCNECDSTMKHKQIKMHHYQDCRFPCPHAPYGCHEMITKQQWDTRHKFECKLTTCEECDEQYLVRFPHTKKFHEDKKREYFESMLEDMFDARSKDLMALLNNLFGFKDMKQRQASILQRLGEQETTSQMLLSALKRAETHIKSQIQETQELKQLVQKSRSEVNALRGQVDSLRQQLAAQDEFNAARFQPKQSKTVAVAAAAAAAVAYEQITMDHMTAGTIQPRMRVQECGQDKIGRITAICKSPKQQWKIIVEYNNETKEYLPNYWNNAYDLVKIGF